MGLVGGPVLNLAAAVVGKQLAAGGADPSDGEVALATVDAAPGLLTLSTILDVVAAPLLLVMGVAIALLTRGRAPVVARVMAVLITIGTFGYAAVMGVTIASGELAHLADRQEAVALYSRIMSQTAAVAIVAIPFLIGMFGFVFAFALAIWRARIAPRWTLATLLAFLVLDFGVGAVGPAGILAGAYLAATARISPPSRVGAWPLRMVRSPVCSRARCGGRRTPQIGMFLPLLFPSGEPASRRWRCSVPVRSRCWAWSGSCSDRTTSRLKARVSAWQIRSSSCRRRRALW